MDKDVGQLRALGYKILEPVACGSADNSREGLLLERRSKLQSDRQYGRDATTASGVLYVMCTGECCAERPLELHSTGGRIYSGNAFEAHAGRSYRKKWRETIRVLPHNISLKAWLTKCGRVDRSSESGGRREPSSKEELLEAAIAAVAAAAAAVDSSDFARPQATAAQPAYSAAWQRQPDVAMGQHRQPEQWQWQPAAAAAAGHPPPGSTPGAGAECPMHPAGMANAGLLLHHGFQQRQEHAAEEVPDGTHTLIQQLGRQIRSHQPQEQEHGEDAAAAAGSEQETPLLQAIKAFLGPAAQQAQEQQEQQQHEQQRQGQHQQQAYQIEQLGAALFALAQQHQEQGKQLRQQQEHMHTQQQQVAQLQAQVQQQAAQHQKLIEVVPALSTAVDALGGDGSSDVPSPACNILQQWWQQQYVQLFKSGAPPAPTPASAVQSGGGAGQEALAPADACAYAAGTAVDDGGGRKRPRDHVVVSID